MKRVPQMEKVTGVTVVLLVFIAFVVYPVMYTADASEQLKTIVVQSFLLALAAVTGYWLNSSVDQAKKDEPAKPSVTTTTTVIPPEGADNADQPMTGKTQ